MNKVIFAHLNINSIRNKFEELISQVKGTVDVLMISETKIDDSFPIVNFLIAFDCLDHELLIAKLHAYGFSLPALRLINDYLSNRKQRTRIGNSFSDWCEIILGVPQGSILGPLLFNIFLADLFLALKDVDIANFADDNTPYTSANNIDELIDSLEKASSNLFK